MNTRLRVKPFAVSLIIALAALFLLAACSSSEPSSNPDDDNSNQNGTPTPRPTPGGAVSANEACDAFDNAGGFGGFGGIPGGFANLISGAQGGPTVQAQYSVSPPSSEAGEIASFIESALEDALDGSVTAGCYWEISASQNDEFGRALWVSLELPSAPSSSEVQAIQNSLTSRGATVGGFFSNPTAGDASSIIIIGDLPLGFEGEAGGMLMMTEEFAVLIVGQSSESNSGSSPTPAPTQPSGSGSTATSAPRPTSTPVPQVVGGAQEITDTIKASLEDELGFDLEVEGAFQSSAGGQTNVIITFRIPEGSDIPSDVAARFQNVATSASASISGVISVGGSAIVTFEDMEIGGASANGTFALSQEQDTILVTLQF